MQHIMMTYGGTASVVLSLGALLLLLLLLLFTAIEFALGGSSFYTSTDKTNKNGRYRSALRPGYFTQRKILGCLDAGVWVGNVAGLDATQKRKISLPFGNRTPIDGVHAAA